MHVAVAVTAVAVTEVAVATTHKVEFRTMEDLRTMVIVAGMAEELTEGMAADIEENMATVMAIRTEDTTAAIIRTTLTGIGRLSAIRMAGATEFGFHIIIKDLV